MKPDSRHDLRLRERLREATQQAILEAAEQTFAERGIHGARMEDVASRAGVAVGTLYNYFGDKKHVVTALLDGHRVELLGRLDAALSPRRPFAEALVAWLDAALAHIEAHRAFFAVFLAEDAGGERTGQRTVTMLEEITVRATRLVRAGVDQKALRAEHVDLYPLLLVALVRTAAKSTLHARGKEPLAIQASALADVFLHGAGVHGPPRAGPNEQKGDGACKRPHRV
jgi:AcrR family transcriptional regulator